MDVKDRIMCYVDSCEYWENGNRCDAKQIQVDNMPRGRAGRGEMELGTLGSGRGEATSSAETCCSTFAPQGKGRVEKLSEK